MRFVLFTIATVLLLAPAFAGAEQLTLGTRGTTVFDDNVFLDEDDTKKDFSFRVEPWFRLESDEGAIDWSILYEPRVEKFGGEAIETAWDHHVTAEASWLLGPRTRLEFYDRFSRTQSIDSELASIGGATVSQVNRQRFKSNLLNLRLVHAFDARNRVAVGFQHSLQDRAEDLSTDSNTIRLTGNYLHTLDSRNQIGFSSMVSRQILDSDGGRGEEETDFLNLSGIWEHSFDETFRITMSAGPTWVRRPKPDELVQSFEPLNVPLLIQSTVFANRDVPTALLIAFDADTCPQLSDGTRVFNDAVTSCQPIRDVNGDNQLFAVPFAFSQPEPVGWNTPDVVVNPERSDLEDLTFFAQMELVKEWDRVDLSLSYEREDSPSSNFGTSTIEDSIVARVDWRPRPRWEVSLVTDFSRRERANDPEPRGRLGQIVRPVTCTIGVEPLSGLCPVALAPTPPDGMGFDPLPAFTFPPNTAVNGGFTSFVSQASGEDDTIFDTRITARVTHTLTRNLRVFATASFIDRKVDQDAVNSFDEFTRFRAGVGFAYRFDPINF